MKFAKILAAAVAVGAIGLSVAVAQQNPIAARQALMKENSAQGKIAAAMIKGERPFDLAAAQKIFAAFEKAGTELPNLVPPDSKTGGDTRASAKIWEDMNGFKAVAAKFASEAKAAKAAVKDLDSFKAQFSTVTKSCGGCHETYRTNKS